MAQLLQLIAVFFKIGLFSIGGGYAIIPLIQAQIVDRLGWISEQTFTDIITISQMTPGPLAVNASTFIGLRVGGIPGALLATAGCVISGVLLSLLLYRFFGRHRQSACLFQVLGGLKASSLGLIVSAAVTILLLTFTGSGELGGDMSPDPAAMLLFLCALILLRKWKVNPVYLMIAAGIAGGFIYR